MNKNKFLLFTIFFLFLSTFFTGCVYQENFIEVVNIKDIKNQFLSINNSKYLQLSDSIKNAINKSNEKINISIDELGKFLSYLFEDSSIVDIINRGSYCHWFYILQYNNTIYRIKICFNELNNYILFMDFDNIAYDMNEQNMQKYPHLKIAIENKTFIKLPISESNSLHDLLDPYDNFIKYKNEYYEVGFISAD